MYKQIIINVAEHETRVALLEDGTIAELFIERKDGTDSAGNIYKGRVQRVLPGMQAAFVDIGLSQAAFIYVDDVIGERIEDVERYFNEKKQEEENDSEESEEDIAKDIFIPRQNIEGIITEGQELLVQV
ncbi:MAG: Rne/Rng family ribonuclease, partial [Deltaproteobacteria bacterium]|nr:Rne/Rng family ribonuclease [Deltaproteobacteria bacterium]